MLVAAIAIGTNPNSESCQRKTSLFLLDDVGAELDAEKTRKVL